MTTLNLSESAPRTCALCIAIAALLLFASISPAFGQERSQDRDNPTLIEGKGITDKLDGSGDEYFYKFTVGAGKLEIWFKVTASGNSAGATLDLYDASSSRPILSNVLVQGVDGGSGQESKSVMLVQQQNVIIMRIKGVKYGDSGGTGVYVVGIEGNVAPLAEAKPATPTTAAKPLEGELDGTDNGPSHTLSITGPGKVTLTFNVKASGQNAGANFELLDSKGRILLDVLVQSLDEGSERMSRSVSFAKSQIVTLRVKGISYGNSGGQGVYSVQFAGPIKFQGPD
jgi:hypothetical protein